MRKGTEVLCGDGENPGHAPQTSSVPQLDHTLMRHLCESQASLTLVPPVMDSNNNNNNELLKNALNTQSKLPVCWHLTDAHLAAPYCRGR